MTEKNTTQLEFWKSAEGDAYTDRNPQSVAEENEAYAKEYGVTRSAMNERFLSSVDHSAKILEVGANLGLQLAGLRHIGFTNLLGLEVNAHAIQQAKRIHPEVDIVEGSAFDLPFKDGWFDLVYTSGVLIHISPDDIETALREIYRVSGRYIWGFEYYAPELTDIEYRGKKGLLWKRDFAALYQKLFPDLKVVRIERFASAGTPNEDQMFLLEKPQP